MSEFEFVDLPEERSNLGDAAEKITAFREFLQSSPGQWAKFPLTFSSLHSAGTTRTNINSGRYKPLPKEEYRARMHQGELYVSYIGEE